MAGAEVVAARAVGTAGTADAGWWRWGMEARVWAGAVGKGDMGLEVAGAGAVGTAQAG